MLIGLLEYTASIAEVLRFEVSRGFEPAYSGHVGAERENHLDCLGLTNPGEMARFGTTDEVSNSSVERVFKP